jgi:hypothetical protein
MEGGRDEQGEARECRDRLLAAIWTLTEVEDGRACWRAALKQNHRMNDREVGAFRVDVAGAALRAAPHQ